jgi:hypothetical protein
MTNYPITSHKIWDQIAGFLKETGLTFKSGKNQNLTKNQQQNLTDFKPNST